MSTHFESQPAIPETLHQGLCQCADLLDEQKSHFRLINIIGPHFTGKSRFARLIADQKKYVYIDLKPLLFESTEISFSKEKFRAMSRGASGVVVDEFDHLGDNYKSLYPLLSEVFSLNMCLIAVTTEIPTTTLHALSLRDTEDYLEVKFYSVNYPPHLNKVSVARKINT